MKKLITLIGAAATAFGLYATTAPIIEAGSNFEYGEDPGVPLGGTGAYNFAATWGENTLWYALGGFTGIEGTVTNDLESSDHYLVLDTDTNILFRTAAAVAGGGASPQQVDVTNGVVFSQIVKFTAFEEDPTDLGDAKLAVWLKATDAGETNLYVSTAKLNAGFTPTPTNLVLSIPNGIVVLPDTFHELKITAIQAASFGAGYVIPGFVVSIDDKDCTVSDSSLFPAEVRAQLTPAASKLVAEGKLLPSRIAALDAENGQTVMGVGYQGTGSLNDVIIWSANEFEYGVEITVPEHASIYSVGSTNGYNVVLKDGKYYIASGDSVEVTLQADSGYVLSKPSQIFTDIKSGDPLDVDEIEVTPIAYTVTFINGVTEELIDQTNVVANATVVAPAVPTVTGMTFDNWYETNSVGEYVAVPFNFATVITNALDIFAKYTNTLYTITATGHENAEVSMEPAGPYYTNNQVVVITATATSGCEYAESAYSGWTKDGNTLTTNYVVNATSNVIAVPDATVASPVQPINPETPVDVQAATEGEATNKVEVVVPAGLVEAQYDAYRAMFTKTATLKSENPRTYTVKAELSAATSNEVQTAITTANAATLTNVLAIAANTSTNVVVTTKPGLYYQIVASTVLPISAPASDSKNWQMAIGDTESLPVTRPSGPKAFFKVYCTDVVTP